MSLDNSGKKKGMSRRDLLKTTGVAAAVVAGVKPVLAGSKQCYSILVIHRQY